MPATPPPDASPSDGPSATEPVAGILRGRPLSARELRAIGVFLALAFGLSWLVALPLWLGEGLASPWFLLVAVGMMATPAIAALVVVFLVDRPPHRARVLGLWPLTPVRRLLGYAGLAVLVPTAIVLAALPVGALLGVYPADFTHFSGFQELLGAQLRAAGAPPLPLPASTLVLVQLLAIPFAAVVNLVPALGEELGWRGWLLPRLLPLGTVPALLLSGVIWGLWHSPLILLGYDYPGVPGWLGVASMTGMCILVGAIFGWLRIRSDSVWPAALAHGTFNAAAGSFVLFSMAGSHVDTTQATILGWSGWILPLALVVVLVATGRFRPVRAREAAAHDVA